jgi:hypothetical protein
MFHVESCFDDVALAAGSSYASTSRISLGRERHGDTVRDLAPLRDARNSWTEIEEVVESQGMNVLRIVFADDAEVYHSDEGSISSSALHSIPHGGALFSTPLPAYKPRDP